MILNTIIRCSKRLEKTSSCHDEKIQVEELVGDMVASILFHLADNLATFVEQAQNSLGLAMVPGRSIGGLLLMYPLFVTSHLPVVPAQSQSQMRDCLAWIGSHMGIGEATMLSSVRELKLQIITMREG
jgi:hypothetical protein